MLGGTTSLLLLAVFAVVNVAVLVLRRDKVDHKHFRAGVVHARRSASSRACGSCCRSRPVVTREQYQIAGVLLALGVLLWVVTWFTHGREAGATKAPTGRRDASRRRCARTSGQRS